MALTLPYPTMSSAFAPTGPATVDQFGPSTVHGDSTHNNPHAKLLKNDTDTRDYINSLEATLGATVASASRIVQSIDNSEIWQYQIGNDLGSGYIWYPKLPIPLAAQIASGFDFNSYGVISWYMTCFGGQSNEEGAFTITTGAGDWVVWRERNVRFPVAASPPVDSSWRQQFVEFSLKDYRGLTAAVGNYNYADCRPASLFCPTNCTSVESRSLILNEAISAYDAQLAYTWFGRHMINQYGSGSNPVHFMNIYGFWNPARPVLSYPRVGYVLNSALPGGSITWLPQ